MIAEGWLWLIVVAGPVLFGAVEPWSLLILQTLLILFPLICALSLPRSEDSFLKAPLVPPLMVLLALGCLQLHSPRPLLGPQSVLLSTVDPARTSAALVLYACYGAVLICAPRVLARPGAARRLAWLMFLSGAAIACIGLIQAAQGNAVIYGFRVVAPDRNPFGPYYNRNHAAALMAMALPIGVGLAYGRIAAWRRSRSFEAKVNLSAQAALMSLPVCAIVGALSFISSRGATAGLAGGAGFALLWSLAATRIRKMALVAILLGAGIFVSRPLLARLPSLETASGPSVATRISMYRSGTELWKDSPLFGVGLGAFMPAFAPYWEHPRDGAVDHLHCDWAEVALESGVLGLTAAIAGFCAFLFGLAGIRNAELDGEARALMAGALVAVVAGILHAFVEFSLRIPGNAVFFLAAAVLAGACGAKAAKPAPRGGWRGAIAPAAVVVAFLILTGLRLASVLPESRAAGLPLSEALNRVTVQIGGPSSDYRFTLAQAFIRRADSEPERRVELLRAALAQASAGLKHDPANPMGQRIMGAILAALDREGDARFHRRLEAI